MSTKTNSFIFLVICCLPVLTWSCGPKSASTETAKEKDPVATLEAAVMAAHDSSMGQMGTIMQYRKAVKRKLVTTDSLLALRKNEAGLLATQKEGNRIEASLNEADAEMMEWMHGYNSDTLSKLDQAKALDYLSAEQIKIDRVRDMMKKSTSEAKTYVQ